MFYSSFCVCGTFTCSPLKQMDRVHRLLPLANWLPAARLALALATARYPGCLDPLTPPVALVFQYCFGCYSRVGKRKAPLPSPPAIPRPAHQRCARGLAPSCEPGPTRFASRIRPQYRSPGKQKLDPAKLLLYALAARAFGIPASTALPQAIPGHRRAESVLRHRQRAQRAQFIVASESPIPTNRLRSPNRR